ALARRALAKAHVTERPLAAPFQSQADAGGLGDLRADCAGPDDDAAAATSEISRRLAPAARWVGGPGKGRQHQLLRREAAGKSGGEVSIVKTEAIAARVEGGDGRHLSDLVAARRNDERELSCAVQDKAPVVKRSGPEHRAIGVQDTLPGKGCDV